MGDLVGMVAVVIGGAQRQRAAPRHVNSALVPGDIQLSDALLTLTPTGWVCELDEVAVSPPFDYSKAAGYITGGDISIAAALSISTHLLTKA